MPLVTSTILTACFIFSEIYFLAAHENKVMHIFYKYLSCYQALQKGHASFNFEYIGIQIRENGED
jgi:hypothetical protein